MHELSIALSIIDLVEEETRKAGGTLITEVQLEVGMLAGVDFKALELAIEMAKQNTMLEHSVIRIDKIPGKGRCKKCNTGFSLDDLISSCPVCHNHAIELMQGGELRVESIIVN
jgi:hydrogenase nickel incorporation protein HypA/HybF